MYDPLTTTARGGLLLALALWAPMTPLSAQRRSADTQLSWQGERVEVEALPDGLSEQTRSTLELWIPWARERDYDLALSEDQRVLFVHDLKKTTLKKRMAKIEKSIELTDRLFPLPARPISPPTAERSDGDGSWTTSWSEDGPPLETGTIVLFQTQRQGDTSAVLDAAASRHSYLENFAASSRDLPGFMLQRPLCAAWTDGGAGQEEFSAENELVHRLTQLLILRRFGQMPTWLTLGIGWYAELELTDSVYCFPYREGFVFSTEHADWDKSLKREFKKVGEIDLDSLANWRQRPYSSEDAHLAWGLVSFLASHRSEALSPALEDLRLLRDDKGIQRHSDGSWVRIAGFEVSTEDQHSVFEARAGEDVFAELLSYCQKGNRYRAPKR